MITPTDEIVNKVTRKLKIRYSVLWDSWWKKTLIGLFLATLGAALVAHYADQGIILHAKGKNKQRAQDHRIKINKKKQHKIS